MKGEQLPAVNTWSKFIEIIILLLKGPKREIFVAGIFTEIRSVWVGDLETRPKNLKSLCLGP